MAAKAVAEHYNARPNLNKEERSHSRIIHLRGFNNWVKSILISSYVKQGDTVLDICCGKGGDLPKWTRARIGLLVAADIAAVSVEQAQQRYASGPQKFPAYFLTLDCFGASVSDALHQKLVELGKPDTVRFDLVSCQFSMHYAFETEARVRQFLDNVTSRLKVGGYFIGTIPDANVIVKRLRSIGGLEFGNTVYKITFPCKFPLGPFGAGYKFTLVEAVDNLTEYLVHFPTFQRLASEYGLELEFKQRFHEFYQERVSNEDNKQLLYKMGALDENGTISTKEWEAIGLYLVFAFRKVKHN